MRSFNRRSRFLSRDHAVDEIPVVVLGKVEMNFTILDLRAPQFGRLRNKSRVFGEYPPLGPDEFSAVPSAVGSRDHRHMDALCVLIINPEPLGRVIDPFRAEL